MGRPGDKLYDEVVDCNEHYEDCTELYEVVDCTEPSAEEALVTAANFNFLCPMMRVGWRVATSTPSWNSGLDNRPCKAKWGTGTPPGDRSRSLLMIIGLYS